MATIFEKYQQLLDSFRAVQPLSSEVQAVLDKKNRLEFNYNSNHMEGNTLTYSETELLLLFDDTKGSHTLREYEEMKAHDVAYQMIHDWSKKDRSLTQSDIKALNQVILVRPFYKEAMTSDGQNTRRLIDIGVYKKHPNSVRLANGEVFEYTSPIDTPIKMGELIDWLNGALAKSDLDAVVIAARLHYDFVRIHPFDDGNGRISRLLMNYVLLRADLPPIVIKSKGKADYLRALNRADAGDFEAFINYTTDQLCWSLDLYLKAARGESLEEAEDLDKELDLLNRRLKGKVLHQVSLSEIDLPSFIIGQIIPVFRDLGEKIYQIEGNFFHSHKEIRIQGGQKILDIAINADDPSFNKSWLNLENDLSGFLMKFESQIQRITFIYDLKGLKTSQSATNLNVSLIVDLNPFHFLIMDGSTALTLSYSEPIDRIRMNERFISPIIRKLISNIEHASK
jgi:Fic family protein